MAVSLMIILAIKLSVDAVYYLLHSLHCMDYFSCYLGCNNAVVHVAKL